MDTDQTLLDAKGRLRRDDIWMRSRIRNAIAAVENKATAHAVAHIEARGAEQEQREDEAYDNFYGVRFPRVYRATELYWVTFRGPHSGAIMLVCSTLEDIRARVMFRLDSRGMVCAHAYGIAVTEPMMKVAKERLPKLKKLAELNMSARKTKRKTCQPMH